MTSNEFRNGSTIDLDGDAYVVVEFLHVKPGKGAAFVRTKLKNLRTGGIVDHTFRGGEKVTPAQVERKTMTFSYEDGGIYYFMDAETFDLVPLSGDLVMDSKRWLNESMECTVVFYQGQAIGVDIPNFVEMEITECEPGVRGNTATGATKPAKVATGAVVQVPLFVNEGDVIRIDTRTGDYLTRV